MHSRDTIIAPATAVGEGGIAIVRISGPDSLEITKQYFRPSSTNILFQSHRLYHGLLVDPQGQHIDEVMVVHMAAPHTYTRDDVVEIHCHGSQQVVRAILHLFMDQGLRLAQPGEFTYRAFINGRLDLSQAEAVAQLIHAKSDSSRKLALAQVEGQLGQTIYQITEKLRDIRILLEAWIDFPEEDLPQEDLARILRDVSLFDSEIKEITNTYNSGRVLTEGASILLVGRPNAGKSSLLNTLLGEERAIVTDIPGTTRDLLEEGMVISGVPVRLVDTAGLRHSIDPVEMEGVRRAKIKVEQADLVLFLVDGSRSIDDQDLYAHQVCSGNKAFLVLNKNDLPTVADTSFCHFPAFSISTKSGEGLDHLRDAIAKFLLGDHLPSAESVMITEQRHFDALIACHKCLERFCAALRDNHSLEFLVFELREALFQLGQISGETTTDAVLAGIFSRFCIGK